jgi:hypothetical protein
MVSALPTVFNDAHSMSVLPFCTSILLTFPITSAALWRTCLILGSLLSLYRSVCAILIFCATGNVAWHCVNVALYFLSFRLVPHHNLLISCNYTKRRLCNESLRCEYSWLNVAHYPDFITISPLCTSQSPSSHTCVSEHINPYDPKEHLPFLISVISFLKTL